MGFRPRVGGLGGELRALPDAPRAALAGISAKKGLEVAGSPPTGLEIAQIARIPPVLGLVLGVYTSKNRGDHT